MAMSFLFPNWIFLSCIFGLCPVTSVIGLIFVAEDFSLLDDAVSGVFWLSSSTRV